MLALSLVTADLVTLKGGLFVCLDVDGDETSTIGIEPNVRVSIVLVRVVVVVLRGVMTLGKDVLARSIVYIGLYWLVFCPNSDYIRIKRT